MPIPGSPQCRPRFWHRGLGAVIIAAGVLMPVGNAVALWDDRFELFVSQKVTYDDNVFRISDSLDPAVVLGSPSKADTYYTTSLGFNLDVPVSRQRFQAGLARIITRYDQFTVLNLDNGREGRAAWLWQAGNELSGQLGYTETLALASLANTRSGVLSGTPNVLETQRAYFNAAYRVTPRWRLRGETSRLKQSNEIPVFQVNDVVIDGAELALSYVTPADNQVGLSLGVEEGSFPNRQFLGGILLDNGYRQHRAAVVTEWTLTGHSRINARAGWVSRSHEQLPQRDFDGATFHAAYDWKPGGNLSFAAIAQRDISPLDDLYSRFVLLTGVALRPTLRLTEKTSLAGTLDYSEREYRSDPGVVLGIAPTRTDQVRIAAATVSYQPTRTITLQLTLQRETRASTIALADYEVNIVSATARIGF